MLSAIACVNANMAIGKDGDLLYKIWDDMQYFKKITSGETVIMGAGTARSLPKFSLPGRRNIIISNSMKQSDLNTADVINNNISITDDIDAVVHHFSDISYHDENAFVIGGESIYQYCLPYCRRLYLTFVHDKELDGDRHFIIPDDLLFVLKEIAFHKLSTDEKTDKRYVITGLVLESTWNIEPEPLKESLYDVASNAHKLFDHIRIPEQWTTDNKVKIPFS